jgi:hypothetical protein
MASQRFDDRQQMLLFSSAQPRNNLGSFSFTDLKMRNLKAPGERESSMVRLPLYWFIANANSPHQCLNVPESIELIENGPEAVRLRVIARNPADTAESDVDVTIPFLQDRLRFDLSCQFTALDRWDFNSIQYCNFFPEERCYPEGWGTDRLLALADHRASMETRILSGEMFQQYAGKLFVAQYGGPRGDIISLSRPR